MIDLPSLPQGLPWQMGAYLLLDGVRLPSLIKQMHLLPNRKECLYAGTRWIEMLNLSPYLVTLTGPYDPVLDLFLKDAWLEPGYLLFGKADSQTLCAWLRSQIVVEHPSGDAVMMRVADPAVLHQLLSVSLPPSDARWFGPIEHMCLPDSFVPQWHEHSRPVDAPAVEISTVRLTDEELTALGEVEFRRFVLGLVEHINTYFPHVMAGFSTLEQRQHAQQLAEIAYGKGFYSAQEVTLYANVVCYLAGQKVESYPDIAQLLSQTSSQTPLERVQRAAALAETRSFTAQGTPQ